ncbi:hypothetical protein [Nocardia nova]|uniref:hypothetical protein n=1 Tax=Nocardia nova TaxID=37330 RepID=UPI0033D5C303
MVVSDEFVRWAAEIDLRAEPVTGEPDALEFYFFRSLIAMVRRCGDGGYEFLLHPGPNGPTTRSTADSVAGIEQVATIELGRDYRRRKRLPETVGLRGARPAGAADDELTADPHRLRQSYRDPEGAPLLRVRKTPPPLRLMPPVLIIGVLAPALAALTGHPAAIDTVMTIFLFVVLTPLLPLACYLGATMLMLSDRGPSSGPATALIWAAVIGPGAGAIVVDVAAMWLAASTPGPTFYVPLAAAAAGALWVLLITGVAGVILTP